MLEAETLMAKARKAAGLSDFGEAPLEGLSRFCTALNERPGNTAERTARTAAAIEALLAERLRIEECYRRNPELNAVVVAPVVNVVGLPRSGTTALSQYLSEDPAMRSIRRWELDCPTPPPDDAATVADPRIASMRERIAVRDKAIPSFRSMLPLEVDDPSEHNTPMSFTFLNIQTAVLQDVESYELWLLESDLRPGYAYLKKVLALLQWKTPRQRWNLKNPMDLFALPAFRDVFEDAKLIWIHRDPVSTIGSVCNLTATIREAGGEALDRKAHGRHLVRLLSCAIRRAMRDRDEHQLQIVDLANADLSSDPVRSIGNLYERLGLTFSAEFERRLQTRLLNRPRGQYGKHNYSLQEFGLTEAEIRAEFQDYTDRFAVKSEW